MKIKKTKEKLVQKWHAQRRNNKSKCWLECDHLSTLLMSRATCSSALKRNGRKVQDRSDGKANSQSLIPFDYKSSISVTAYWATRAGAGAFAFQLNTRILRKHFSRRVSCWAFTNRFLTWGSTYTRVTRDFNDRSYGIPFLWGTKVFEVSKITQT